MTECVLSVLVLSGVMMMKVTIHKLLEDMTHA
jgi:hypothetical protein